MKTTRRLITTMIGVACTVGIAAANDITTEPLYYPVIIDLDLDVDPGASIKDLEDEGVVIWRQRDNLLLACVPRQIQNLSAMRGVRSVEKSSPRFAPRQNRLTMDIAKTHYGAPEAIAGKDMERAYTGKGVVTGFCDVGFDPLHINFIDSEGRCRVKRFVAYDEVHAKRTEMNSVDEYREFATDTYDNTHATHVAGIMSGSYNDNGYSGIAVDADIVATTSSLYDVGLLAGVEDVIEYAASVGKPAVVNMSVSAYNGPHDGTSLFCQYIEKLGKEAIVCLSAGNDGNNTNHYSITFSPDQRTWRARLHSTDWTQFTMNGMVDFWSPDTRGAQVKLLIFDDVTRQNVYESDYCSVDKPFVATIQSGSDPEFSKYFTGIVQIDGDIDPYNERWRTRLQYSTRTDIPSPTSPSNNWARYVLGFEVTGENGVHADIHADGAPTKMVSWPGYEAGNSLMSISDIASGPNIVCVGMYNSRKSAPIVGADDKIFDFDPMLPNAGSSYGTLADGTVLPHTIAPGAGIISSGSTHYFEKNPEMKRMVCAEMESDGRTNYWYYNSGTSMSTPYVAGFIATWLEANPNLTVSDVLEILKSTNDTDCPNQGNPRNGQGWFRPYEALKKVVEGAGIDSVSGATDKLRIVKTASGFDILNPDGGILVAEVTAIDGRDIMQQRFEGSNLLSIDTSTLPGGVYIVTARTASGGISRKVML